MGLYLSMVSENGEVIIDNIKLLIIGSIFEKLLKINGQIKYFMEIGKEYYLDLQDIPKIIKYYDDRVSNIDDYYIRVVLYDMILEPLKKEWDMRINENKKYIIKIE